MVYKIINYASMKYKVIKAIHTTVIKMYVSPFLLSFIKLFVIQEKKQQNLVKLLIPYPLLINCYRTLVLSFH